MMAARHVSAMDELTLNTRNICIWAAEIPAHRKDRRRAYRPRSNPAASREAAKGNKWGERSDRPPITTSTVRRLHARVIAAGTATSPKGGFWGVRGRTSALGRFTPKRRLGREADFSFRIRSQRCQLPKRSLVGWEFIIRNWENAIRKRSAVWRVKRGLQLSRSGLMRVQVVSKKCLSDLRGTARE